MFFVFLAALSFVSSVSAFAEPSTETPTASPTFTVDDTFTVSVDCNINRAIKAGKYNWVSEDINPTNFPEPGCKTGKTEVTIVRLNRDITSADSFVSAVIHVKLQNMGLRPANLSELLAFGAQHPEIQKKFRIVAFGSGWINLVPLLGVPFLDEDSEGRLLNLYWDLPGAELGAARRLLAVRK